MAALGAAAARLGQAVLRTYGQILFSRSPWVGALLLLSTALVPRSLLFGLLAVTAALGTARLLDLDEEATLAGVYGYNALLIGLGAAQTFAGIGPPVALAVVGAAGSVVITAGLRAWLGGPANLPFLSLPFLAVFYPLLTSAALGGVPYAAPLHNPSALAALLPASLVGFLRSLGGLFFLPRLDTGLVVLAALFWHSRIATVLAGLGFGAVLLLCTAVLPLLGHETLHALAYNAIFTAVGLGGVWFVPSVSSFLFALGGVLLCALLGAGALGPLGRLGLPVLILPFNVTVLLMLLATRQRGRDRRPKAVDFLPGTPEENLSFFRTRVARFRALYAVRFQLPVSGRWTCTQAVGGQPTHQGPWRHAFDFEVMGPDGDKRRGAAPSPTDYHCYRLPVVAAAAGTVVKIENEVPDNQIGEMNLEKNWGNLVLLYHGPGLYSLVAHLAPGTVRVRQGQAVAGGEVLGLCGNSGRSPEPHVHFQLQGTPQLGAPTMPCEFSDAVTAAPGGIDQVHLTLVPEAGMVARNLEPAAELAGYFTFPYGETWSFSAGDAVETVQCDVDLYGQQLLRSREHGATLAYVRGEGFFTAYDVVGPAPSVLHVLRAALPRAPLEPSEALRWRDILPGRYHRALLWGLLADAVSPFLPDDGLEMEYRLRRSGALLIIEGESLRRDRSGGPLVRTRVDLSSGAGPLRAEVVVRGKRTVAERAAAAAGHASPVAVASLATETA